MPNEKPNLLILFLSIGLLALIVYLIIAGQSILMPLAIGIFIWYLINAFAGTIRQLNILG